MKVRRATRRRKARREPPPSVLSDISPTGGEIDASPLSRLLAKLKEEGKRRSAKLPPRGGDVRQDREGRLARTVREGAAPHPLGASAVRHGLRIGCAVRSDEFSKGFWQPQRFARITNSRKSVIPGPRSGTRNPERRRMKFSLLGSLRPTQPNQPSQPNCHLPISGSRVRLRRPGMTGTRGGMRKLKRFALVVNTPDIIIPDGAADPESMPRRFADSQHQGYVIDLYFYFWQYGFHGFGFDYCR